MFRFLEAATTRNVLELVEEITAVPLSSNAKVILSICGGALSTAIAAKYSHSSDLPEEARQGWFKGCLLGSGFICVFGPSFSSLVQLCSENSSALCDVWTGAFTISLVVASSFVAVGLPQLRRA